MTIEQLCEDKALLLNAYNQATLVHSEALRYLQSVMGTISKAEYEALYRTAENLRREAQAAQHILERHVTAHRC